MMIGTGGQKSRGGLSQKYIDDRRKEEQLVTHLGAFLKNDQIARHVAHWEVNCKTMQRNQFQKQRMDQLRKDFEQKTNERRRNLKELYDYEEAMYANEMRGLRQTPEQVKQSMINRVAELKEKREVARLKEVEEKLDRRFKEQADELRLVGSKIREMKTKHEQDIQMLEKQKKMEDQYVEEMIYAELWRRDIENKKKIEEVKIQEAIRKNNDRNMILADQVRDLDRKREMDSTLKHSEKQMLKEQWTEEMNRQKEQQLEELRVNKQLNHDIHTHNIEQKRLKKIEDDKIKDQDKRMVDEIVYKEKMLDHLDQEKKERYKEETKNFLLNFKNRSNELKLNQDHIDKLLNDEMERQWKKRQDQWDKEMQGRINLMTDVYANRGDAVQYKKDLEAEERRRKEREKQQVTEELHELKKEDTKLELEEYLKMKQHQNTILWQINERNERKRKEILQDMEEERIKRLQELNYQMRIREEQEKGKQLLEKTKRTRLY